MGNSLSTLSKQLKEKINNLSYVIKQKIPDILAERQKKVREVAVQLAQTQFDSEFSYTYLDIDLKSVRKSLLSVRVDDKNNVIIDFDTNGVNFDIEALKKDTEQFNLNQSKIDAQERLLDGIWGATEEDWNIEGLSEEDIEEENFDLESQVNTNKSLWRSQDFSWANKRNRQGAFTPVSKVVENAKNATELALGNEISSKIDPFYRKKMEDFIKNIK